eukprot:c36376_g1_i1 orf=48-233(+)
MLNFTSSQLYLGTSKLFLPCSQQLKYPCCKWKYTHSRKENMDSNERIQTPRRLKCKSIHST